MHVFFVCFSTRSSLHGLVIGLTRAVQYQALIAYSSVIAFTCAFFCTRSYLHRSVIALTCAIHYQDLIA